MTPPPSDIQDLSDQYESVERETRALVDGVSDSAGAWRASPGSWSAAECLDHLAVANRVYLAAMREPASRAKAQGRARTRPALPGVVGGWFVRTLEPPVKPGRRMSAPGKIRPRTAPALSDAFASFISSHQDVRAFLREYADIDLARVRFPNPFLRGVRFSLATGLHVIGAHERRHLWQARRVLERVPNDRR